jgi:Ca2+-binding EF-hand superfamily protein
MSSSIPDEHLAELRKVFSLVDKDGSNSISSSELGFVMSKISGVEPSPLELKSLMAKMDANNDGMIQWEEFVSSLSSWIAEEDAAELDDFTSSSTTDSTSTDTPTRKRKATASLASSSPGLSPATSRSRVHKRISSFFCQFKRATNFDQIRESLAAEAKEAAAGTSNSLSSTSSASVSSSLSKYSAQDRLNKITRCKTLLSQLPQMLLCINGNSPEEAQRGVIGVGELMSICEVYRTPLERYEIGEFMLTLFRRVEETGIVPRLSKFLRVNDMPRLQYESAQIIAYYAPGPRVAHTPTDSILHPDKMFHKVQVIRSGAVPALIGLLQSNTLEVREASALALGSLSSHHPDVRNLVLKLGAYPALYKQMSDKTPAKLLRKLTWCLSILVGRTQAPRTGANEQPPFELLQQALPKLAFILFHAQDEEIMLNVCESLYHLLPGVIADDALVKRIVLTSKFPSVAVQRVIVRILLNMVKFQGAPMRVLFKYGLLHSINHLLKDDNVHSDHQVRTTAIDIVAIVGGAQGFMKDIMDSSRLFATMISLLHNNEAERFKLLKFFSYATRGHNTAIIQQLVHKYNMVKVLTQALTYCKAYDDVLRDTYRFLGPSYNLHLLDYALEALLNIINTGESTAFVAYFEMECVDKMRAAMVMLAEEQPQELQVWTQSDTKDTSLEDKLRNLMSKIRSAHTKAALPESKYVVTRIDESIKEFDIQLKKSRALLRKNKGATFKRQNSFVGDDLSGSTRSSGSGSGSGGGSGANARASTASRSNPNAMQEDESITLKLFYNQDNRVITIPSDITLTQLSVRVQLKYGKPLTVQYEDGDGDKITIDSKALLDKAFEIYRNSDSDAMKLYLIGHADSDSKGYGRGKHGGHNRNNPGADSRSSLIESMSYDTQFSKKELAKLHKQFSKCASHGRVSRPQFESALKGMGIRDEAMLRQLFDAFDHGKDGFVDFREFVAGLSTMYRGSMEDMLKLAFNAYDIDGNGSIDQEELFQCFKSMFQSQGFSGMDDETMRSMVENVFDKADTDMSGTLDFEEFKQAVLSNQLIVQSFWKQNLR